MGEQKGKDMGVSHDDRLNKLRAMLAARLDGTGKPYAGFAQNVAMIRREIEKLEERLTYSEVEWPSDD